MKKIFLPIAFRKRCSLVHMDHILSQPSADKLQVVHHTQYFTSEHLSPYNVASNPLDHFRVWFKEAVEGGIVQEPEAMSLSTATSCGTPSARMVLLKQVDSRGFVFFTNYNSRKSQELSANPYAALVFYWREVHRSVRIVGSVEKLSRDENQIYFHSRPIGSQLGAWASNQSSVIGEDELEDRLQQFSKQFSDGNIPLPEFWGGWRVIPKYVFFITSFLYHHIINIY